VGSGGPGRQIDERIIAHRIRSSEHHVAAAYRPRVVLLGHRRAGSRSIGVVEAIRAQCAHREPPLRDAGPLGVPPSSSKLIHIDVLEHGQRLF
jgi:hypothetical protein